MFVPEFYQCDVCGNVLWIISNSSSPVVCCGKPMRKLIPGESDGSAEKHVPHVTEKDGKLHVQIGSGLHPFTSGHRIEWIALQTDSGVCFREIPEGELPVADFGPMDGKPVAVYAWCNLHGLWKAELDIETAAGDCASCGLK